MKKLLIFYFIGIFISSIFYFSISEDNAINIKSKVEKKVERKIENNIKNEKKEIKKKTYNISFKKKINKSISLKEWEYIYLLAEKRGYRRHKEEKNLLLFKNKKVSKEIKKDLEKLFLNAKKDNLSLNLISAFRSVNNQKNIFKNKLIKKCLIKNILSGGCDNVINNILEVSSPPNYSKHHTGRAIDFSCENSFQLEDNFRETDCYEWFSKNNFENSKKYNFYPSYPDNKLNQGPNPEPWEFIYKI